jgi:hypothetical protein
MFSGCWWPLLEEMATYTVKLTYFLSVKLSIVYEVPSDVLDTLFNFSNLNMEQ